MFQRQLPRAGWPQWTLTVMVDTKLAIIQDADKATLIELVRLYEQCFTERYQDLVEIALLLNTGINRAEMLSRIKELLAEAGS